MYVVDKKRKQIKKKLIDECECASGCPKCALQVSFVDKLADANIPAAYWFRKLKDFYGPPNLKQAAQRYCKDISVMFDEGASICFTGNLGTGKTYSSCAILKTALMKGFDVYYTTLSDLVFYLSDYELKKEFFSKITRADFLCVDEVDSRHFSDSEQSESFFGRTFERVLRYRMQNGLPLILATNNANLEEAFGGQFKKVVESLSHNSTQVVPALGPDFRLRKE